MNDSDGITTMTHVRRAAGGWFPAALTCLLIAACGGGNDSKVSTQPSAAAQTDAQDGSLKKALASSKERPAALVASTTIVIRARTTMADNVGAFVKLRYNGRIIAAQELRTTEMTDHVFRVNVPIDGGLFDVVFTNATHANGQVARELTVSGVLVNGTPFASSGPGVTYDVGHFGESEDGINVLAGTERLTQTGALRFPMPGAGGLGAAEAVDAATLSAPAGIYVDDSTGSDSNAFGTRDRPFKTLARVQQQPMMGGENIHLRCGSVWRETLTLTNSNLADGTRLVPYGDCAHAGKPVITGGENFGGGWSKNGSVWVRNVPAGTPKIGRLVVAGSPVRTAQWPNAGAPAVAAQGGGAATLTVAPSQASELAGRDLVGASILLRTQPWMVETRRVAAGGLRGLVLPVDSGTEHSLQAGVTYVLRDKAWMLDAAGEFFHDTAANKLYLIAEQAGQDVNGLQIEGSVRDVAVDLRDRRGVGVEGLSIRMTRGDGLRLTNMPDADISGIEAIDHENAGVRFMQWNEMPPGAVGPALRNSFIAFNGQFGVDARYANYSRITDNWVMNIGTHDYIGHVDSGVAGGAGARIENNNFYNIGFTAVRFSALLGSVVARNEIRQYCLRLSDCGAIYTWTGIADHPLASGSLVEGNRIHAGKIVSEGSVPWGHNGIFGIYVDDYSNGVTVRDNFLYAMQVGIFTHNSRNVTIEGNRVWMPYEVGIAVLMDSMNDDLSTNTVVRRNEIVPFTSTSGAWPDVPKFNSVHALTFTHFYGGEAALVPGRTLFHDNRVVQIHGENAEHAKIQTVPGTRVLTAAQWRQLNPGEAVIEQPATFNSYWAALGPEIVPGGQFDGGLGAWGLNYNWQVPGFALEAVGSAAGCTGPCVRMTSATPGDTLHSPAFQLSAGKPHLYRWTAISATADAEVGWPYISRTAWPWDEMQDARGFQGRSTRALKAGRSNEWEAIFVPKSSASAQVNLQLSTQNVPVHFDAVSVREVLMWLGSGPSEWVAPVIADRDAARNVGSCGDIGLPAGCSVLDLSGAAVAFPFTVPANDARMLLWANSPYRKN